MNNAESCKLNWENRTKGRDANRTSTNRRRANCGRGFTTTIERKTRAVVHTHQAKHVSTSETSTNEQREDMERTAVSVVRLAQPVPR